MENSQIISYLGPNSYPAIVSQIFTKLENAKVETLAGNELIQKAIKNLNESITPMLDLKEFTTNAEKIAGNDVKLADILSFITKNVKSGDLNFLINIAKEEHFKEMSRTGFPSPEATIKNYKENFDEPSSIIEQGIKNGIIDKLKSNLLMEIKTSLEPDKNVIVNADDVTIVMNENQVLYNNNLVMYTPIGISMEDIKNNRILLLTENDVLSYNRKDLDFEKIDNVELMNLEIPEGHKKMMSAIQQLTFNPIEESFSLNESWDFDLKLTKDGSLLLSKGDNKNNINKKDLPNFLLESINFYDSQVVKNKNFNRDAYLKDADNFVLLTENHDRLIKLDKLKTIRNLSENNNYVVIEPNSVKAPKLICGSGLTETKIFESYENLNNECNNILSTKLTGLFENQLNIEKTFNKEKFETIVELRESQKELNNVLQETESLINIAQENSPAMEKLLEAKGELSKKLDENIVNLNFQINKNNLYK